MQATTATPLQRTVCTVFGILGTGGLLLVAMLATRQHQWATLRPEAWPLLAALCGGLMFLYVGIAGRLPPFMDAMRQRDAARLETLRQQNREFMEQHGDAPLPRATRLRAARGAVILAALAGLHWLSPALPWQTFAIIAAVLIYIALSGRIPGFIRRHQR